MNSVALSLQFEYFSLYSQFGPLSVDLLSDFCVAAVCVDEAWVLKTFSHGPDDNSNDMQEASLTSAPHDIGHMSPHFNSAAIPAVRRPPPVVEGSTRVNAGQDLEGGFCRGSQSDFIDEGSYGFDFVDDESSGYGDEQNTAAVLSPSANQRASGTHLSDSDANSEATREQGTSDSDSATV